MANNFIKALTEVIMTQAKVLMTVDQFKKCDAAIHSASAFLATREAAKTPVKTTQIEMVMTLGEVFNQTLSRSAANEIISSAESRLTSAASMSVGRSLKKLIPAAGRVVSTLDGFTAVIGWTVALGFAEQASEQTDNDLGGAEEDAQDDDRSESYDESMADKLGELFEEDE